MTIGAPPAQAQPGSSDSSATRLDLFLLFSIALCLLLRLWLASRLTLDRGKDAFCYVALAESLAQGRGFVVDYVLLHFRPYPSVVGRPEDFVPPGLSLLMVPFIKLFGSRYLAYILPSLLAQTVFVPWLIRLLGERLLGSRRLGALAALVVLFNPMLYLWSAEPLTDLPFVALALAGILAFTWIGERRGAALVAGLCLGASILVRTQGQLVVVLLPVVHALRQRRLRCLADRQMVLLIAAAVAVLTPWLIRNWLVFGDPQYSLYRQINATIHRPDIAFSGYRAMWWGPTPPAVPPKGADGERAYQFVTELARGLAYVLGLGLFGVPRPAGLLVFGVPAVLGLSAWRRSWPAWLVALLATATPAAIALAFLSRDRYFALPFVLLMPFALQGWEVLVRRGGRQGCQRTVAAVTCLLCVWGVANGLGPALRAPTNRYPYGMAAYDYLRRELPTGAVILSDGDGYSARTNHSTGHPAVTVPMYVTEEQLALLAGTYHATYALTHTICPSSRLFPRLGWRVIREEGPWRIYRAPEVESDGQP